MKQHPRYHKNQIWEEARQSLITLFWASVLTVPILFAQIRGYTKLYDIGDGTVSSTYEVAQLLYFIVFSETCTYWLHRLFHHPFLFKSMHKKHHRYIIPTPFSAYAFDPLEAWAISLPVYAYSFLWPMSRHVQVLVFVCTNVWSFLIRIQLLPRLTYTLDDTREQLHTFHHKNVQLNCGQYFSTWDRFAGTYGDPMRYRRGNGGTKLSKKNRYCTCDGGLHCAFVFLGTFQEWEWPFFPS
ncbi:hypothetical protein ASPTUDRAFT_937396 [Aspergillus tubingensis CBS 134.48]|uniref:Fatty acid hydroxylase domain-containing protein n=1 Tax=Aspergillus tubingensis (strain CBS 134.48) TaxID=767770 RepID=A0A1L9MTY5_ASPTC|nr:hypothetical protein ASPTUDRAFT_937396 [Aspergillus tubingensis CBS 134.48]